MSLTAVEVVEVGPRDGLQNEAALLPTEVKVEFVRRALAAGVRRIEVASFVHPRLVPQMADAEAVVAGVLDHGLPQDIARTRATASSSVALPFRRLNVSVAASVQLTRSSDVSRSRS